LSREEEKQNAARFVGLLLTLAGLIYFWLGTVSTTQVAGSAATAGILIWWVLIPLIRSRSGRLRNTSEENQSH